jgi:hypothetical protein
MTVRPMIFRYGDLVRSHHHSTLVPGGALRKGAAHAGTGVPSAGPVALVTGHDRAAVLRRLITPDPGTAEPFADLLGRVCWVTARELAASGVGVSVLTDDGGRGVSAASDVVSERLEDLQFTFGEGPCLDAYGARRPVLIADLSGPALTRWPFFAPAIHREGIRAIFAFPLQIGEARLGAMDVFRHRPGPLTEGELGTALLVADITVEVLLERQEDSNRHGTPDGLVPDVGNRAQLFQAQGMVMVQLGISLSEAMTRMRAYAFAENRRLDDVARDIVNRVLTLEPDAS